MKLMDRLKQVDALADIFTYEGMKQFSRYLLTGFLAVGVEYFTFYALYRYIGLWYIASNSIAMAAGFGFSFLVNRFWSFNSKGNIFKQFLLNGILFLINLAISNLCIYALSGILGLSPLLSKVFIMGAIVAWNFFIYKKIIYKN